MLANRVRMGSGKISLNTKLLFSTNNIESRSESSCYYDGFVYSSGYSGIVEKFDLEGNKILSKQVAEGTTSDKLISGMVGHGDYIYCISRFDGLIIINANTLNIVTSHNPSGSRRVEIYKDINNNVICYGSSAGAYYIKGGTTTTITPTSKNVHGILENGNIVSKSSSLINLYSPIPQMNYLDDVDDDITNPASGLHYTGNSNNIIILGNRYKGVISYRAGYHSAVSSVQLPGTTWEVRSIEDYLIVSGSNSLRVYKISLLGELTYLGNLPSAGDNYRNVFIDKEDRILTACGDSGLIAYELGKEVIV